jgi:hypothetical protein
VPEPVWYRNAQDFRTEIQDAGMPMPSYDLFYIFRIEDMLEKRAEKKTTE